jgi:hypothetical protein
VKNAHVDRAGRSTVLFDHVMVRGAMVASCSRSRIGYRLLSLGLINQC